MAKEKMISLILAGGQGTRLGKLTKSTAKPAVPFGGRYRIIDFTLSNVANSGIKTAGVITQYQPLELNDHIGNGSSWGLNTNRGGVTILQPYQTSEGSKMFEGTAHAIYQNIDYIDQQDPDYVLILSGDHIYKMDYDEMLQEHKKNNAALTVGVLPVEWDEASRFGIMNTDDENRVTEFVEKPEHPESNLASMGIYIFNWKTLREYLMAGFSGDNQLMDFGKHVIPLFLLNHEKVFAHAFNGYWRDVGTVQSLWQANMELLDAPENLQLQDKDWQIYSQSEAIPGAMITATADVKNATIADASIVEGTVEHSVLSKSVKVAQGAEIKDSMIMPGASIGKGARVEYAIIGENAVLEEGAAVIGTPGQIALVGYGEIVHGGYVKSWKRDQWVPLLTCGKTQKA